NQELLKALEFRLENLEIMAEDYGNFLQKTVVIFGSHQDDTFVISQTTQNTEIELKASTDQTIAFKKQFSNQKTKEIWLYGFSGNDVFRLENSSDNGILIRIMDENSGVFQMEEAQKNIRIYVPQSLEDTGKAKVY